MIPLHFRDNNNQNLKDIMNIDTGYFMINEHIRQFPSAKLSRESTYEPPFNNDDVYNLTYDHSIDKIYSNKEIDTYFI
jgi:hypothetical protein